MKKVKLTIEETLKYEREVVILVPDEMDEQELQEELSSAERKSGFDGASGIVHELWRQGIDNPDGFDQDLSSPDSIEAGVIDFEILKDGEED